MEQSKTSENNISCSMEMSSEAETAHTEPLQQVKSPIEELAAVESPQDKSSPGTSSQVKPSSVLSFLDESSRSANGPAPKKQCLDSTDLNSLSTSIYLDITVVPILSNALISLDRLRPEDPVQYVIDYLQKHKERFSKNLPKSNGQPPVKEA